jgi:hypothetical protein
MHTHNYDLAVDGLRAPNEAVLFKQAQAGFRACLDLWGSKTLIRCLV